MGTVFCTPRAATLCHTLDLVGLVVLGSPTHLGHVAGFRALSFHAGGQLPDLCRRDWLDTGAGEASSSVLPLVLSFGQFALMPCSPQL